MTDDDTLAKVDRLADETGIVAEKVGRVTEDVIDKGFEISRNFTTGLENAMRQEPIKTLAVAAGVGFLVGALWRV